MRRALIFTTIALIFLLLIVPLAYIFVEAFKGGVSAYLHAIGDPETLTAIRLTATIASISLVSNTIFGLAAAWAITKFDFPGKSVLVTLIDLPFAVSPVIAGLIFVLLFGVHGLLGAWLTMHDIKVIFALPGMIVATIFVTLPFVTRELIPVMQSHGTEEEEAAVMLGASGWQTFWWVTLPNAKWGVLYGTLLCSARAVGEFGAVSVVSGHIRGVTTSLPLHIEILYNDYNFSAAFAVSSLLTLTAIITLIAKHRLETRLT